MNEHDYRRIGHIKDYCEDALELVKKYGDSVDDFVGRKEYFYAVSMILLQNWRNCKRVVG